jgi:hypothetical protein
MRITPPAARGRRPTYVEFGAADWLVLARAPVGGVSGAQDRADRGAQGECGGEGAHDDDRTRLHGEQEEPAGGERKDLRGADRPVRRADSHGGRERPWVRAAKDLRIRPGESATSTAMGAAAGPCSRRRWTSAGGRCSRRWSAVTSFGSSALIVTADEAKDVLQKDPRDPRAVQRRAARGSPRGARRLALFIGVAPDSDLPTDDTPRS